MSDKEFGIPEQKKFPLDTRAHVISAIKFFNYADPQYRKALASRIIRKIHEYNITGLTPSDKNAFYNYYHPKAIAHSGGGNMEYYAIPTDYAIEHHGIRGQKWGVRRYQNSDGSLTSAGKSRYSSYHGYSTQPTQRTMTNASITSGKNQAKKSVSYYGGKHAAAYNVKREATAAASKNARKAAKRSAIVSGAAMGSAIVASALTGTSGLLVVAGGASLGSSALIGLGARKANKILKRHADEQISFINDEGDSTNHKPVDNGESTTLKARRSR